MHILRINSAERHHKYPNYPYPNAKDVTIAYEFWLSEDYLLEIRFGFSFLNMRPIPNPTKTQQIIDGRGMTRTIAAPKYLWDKPNNTIAVDTAVERLDTDPIILETGISAKYLWGEEVESDYFIGGIFAPAFKTHPDVYNVLSRVQDAVDCFFDTKFRYHLGTVMHFVNGPRRFPSTYPTPDIGDDPTFSARELRRLVVTELLF